ncbi:hypothetical protein ACFV0B_16710 [Streptomyces xanthophaeus]|uniref:hypothetical protein n=1 Tax=Streptomyces xanthophaeus TaxID=67385 RepID=UPI0036C67C21
MAEFWQGVDACRAANRYFEHVGRFDGTRTRYCTTAKIALLEGVTRHVRSHAR